MVLLVLPELDSPLLPPDCTTMSLSMVMWYWAMGDVYEVLVVIRLEKKRRRGEHLDRREKVSICTFIQRKWQW